MTFKSLLFCLFLYIALAWVGAAYLYQGPDIIHYGLLWTAIGLIAVLVFVIGARLFGFWRLWRAKAAARPAAAPKPSAPVHPEDEAMAVLLAEANAALAKAPAFAGVRTKTPLTTLPLYLLVGPEGSGKTSTFLNSGLEPQLLAGQGTTPVAPTRLCNIWLAKNAIFTEIGGRAFAGDLNRWGQLLATLRGRTTLPVWRRILGETEAQMDLRGVVAFCDSKEFTGAASDPQRLERYSRDWQERLRAIAEQFGAEFPVYLVLSKSDKITYFPEFFRRLPEAESNQVMGCTLPLNRTQGAANEVFVEAEAKRLTESFRPLYHALARRRLSQLAHEPNPFYRPGVYEFPRELKRIRSSLVQFLTDVFRPYSLGPSAALRGYYFSGTREAEVDLNDPAARKNDSNAGFEATKLFRGDATQFFQGGDETRGAAPAKGKALGTRWLFVADLFHKVVLLDQPPRKIQPAATRAGDSRKLAFGAVGALCVLLCLAFAISWINNRRLLSDVSAAAAGLVDRPAKPATLQDLQALDRLRDQLVRLQGHMPLSFHWGLYSGDRVFQQARIRYFRQFGRVLLFDMNAQMVAGLSGLPSKPDPNAPSDLVYRTLKGHLMISSAACGVDPPFVSRLLKDMRAQMVPTASTDWQVLADRQIDFYAAELAHGNPLKLSEDPDAREHARQYLRNAQGIDRLYTNIVASAESKLGKTSRLSDLASNYTQVMAGPDEVSSAFSIEGWALVQKASKENNASALGDACVLGGSSGASAGWQQNSETAQAVQRLYFHDYIDHWRKFVEGFSVIRYSGAADAARKLDILADHKSPLLAVLALTANHTNFPAAPAQSDANVVQKTANKLLAPFKKAETEAKAVISTPEEASDGMSTPADVTVYFQPVHSVEPPGSETWVVDKNAAYIDALAQLRRSMQDIAQGGSNPDPAVHQMAAQNYEKALDTVRQISKAFKPVGVGGLDATVERLLEEPIRQTNAFIIKDIGKVGVNKINNDLRNFCLSQRKTLGKFPFQASSTDDASLDEFSALFDPMRGAIWKFQQQALGDFVVKEGSQWKSKDPSKKPQVTPDLLAFLNRAQSVTTIFFGSGTQPQFSYTFRPKLDARLKDSILALDVDGRPFQWTTPLQHQFSWPAPPGTKETGAVARLHSGSIDFAFASRGGVWGIFRVLNDAEPREMGAKLVEWRYTTGSAGRREPMNVPVQLEIVGFPGGQDVFHPKFWDGIRCPSAAVQ